MFSSVHGGRFLAIWHGFEQNAKCICWPNGTLSFWPSFFQKDCIPPERTPAVALIEAFIPQLGQAFSDMQLEQHFKGPHCYTNASILCVRGRRPVKCPDTQAVRMDFSKLSLFFFWLIFHLEKFSKKIK